jgi:hypothetical protein
MKKLVSTFGLLTLMLIVTSFTTPNETGGRGNEIGLGLPKPITPLAIETGGRGNEIGLGLPKPITPLAIETGGRGNEIGLGLGK